MAKATKEKVKKEVKPSVPLSPDQIKDRVKLFNILALLLAIAAFLLQLFAVVTHHWKWQGTSLGSIISPNYHYAHPNVYNDSRLDQDYGLFSREVSLKGNNDEQLDVWASTRFPRVDEGEGHLYQCLSQTTTLRGAFLTCSDRVVSSEQCHCRRYTYWNVVIVFEILALILLGIVVFLVALLATQLHRLLRLAAVGIALFAFILLFIGLILILSHLKRETRTISDIYPHIHQRLANKLHLAGASNRANQQNPSVLHRVLRRDTHEHYRLYNLLPGQYAYNDTHFQEYSEREGKWVHTPYKPVGQPVPYAPLSQQNRVVYTAAPRAEVVTPGIYGAYGPVLGYDTVFDNTHACISWSTVLSILAMILALLLALILILAFLTDKKLGPDVKTVKTVVETKVVGPESVPLTKEIYRDYDPHRPIADAVVTTQHIRQIPFDTHSGTAQVARQIHDDYDPHRPISDAVVSTHYVRPEPVIVRDVIVPGGEHPRTVYSQPFSPQTQYTQDHSFPVNVQASHRT